MSPRLLLAGLVTALALTATNSSFACDHCGCSAPCQKVCRLVKEKKKVEIICWGCKCEDFCLPGPSKRGCKNCDWVCEYCDDADSKDICVQPKKFVWYDWIPGCCAKVHTKKKLMQRKEIKEIASFKWKVETLCGQCCVAAESCPVPVGTELPPLPTGLGAAARILPVGYLSREQE